MGESSCSIFQSAAAGDFERLRRYIVNGGDLRTKDGQANTLLHHAAIGKQRLCIELLCEHGADVTALNSAGFTPVESLLALELDKRQFQFVLEKIGMAVRSQNDTILIGVVGTLKARGSPRPRQFSEQDWASHPTPREAMYSADSTLDDPLSDLAVLRFQIAAAIITIAGLACFPIGFLTRNDEVYGGGIVLFAIGALMYLSFRSSD